MTLNRRGIIFLVILLVIEAYVIMTQWVQPLSWGIVPITGLNGAITYIFLWLLWPIFGGIIFVLVMPRILGPLFLRMKGAVWSDYVNAYVDLPRPTLKLTRVIRRAIYLGLLTMGIVSILIYIIPPTLLLPPGAVQPPITVFHMASIASIAGLVVPISIALWSSGWSYRDASLVHYKIPDDGVDELYEIEPIHLRFDSFLKGYAGFSSILFIINLVIVQFTTEDFTMALLVLYVFMHVSLLTLPAIYVHSRMNHMWLRKNLPKARRFTKSDVQILED
ncbi:MAG: hypothetical protein KGD60_02435 [Candidatus Thorarchaeota archaeon]|nr:hypothetical protein [Candidatus Thorarchaeota archaeon]